MLTFEDLQFEKHPNSPMFDKQAKIAFENGYGVSVVTGTSAYSSEDTPYEVAVLFEDEICYTSGITDDVIGYCTEEKVSEVMAVLQQI